MANILVVEDECIIRMLLVDIFREANNEVFEAYNGVRALEILASQDIQAVATDNTMPKMGGIELSKRIRKEYPHIKVVMMSGVKPEGTDNIVDAFFPKPFRVEDVLLKIQGLLTAQPA